MRPLEFMELHSESIRTRTAYKLLTPKKHAWLARLLWRGLEKLNALEPYFSKVERHTYRETEQRRVDEAVFFAVDHLMRHGKNPDKYAIIMGAATFEELTGILFRDYQQVPTGRFGFQTADGYKAEFRGLPVHVIPFAVGVSLVPKVLIESKKERKL